MRPTSSFLGSAIVYGEGIEIDRGVATGQGSEVNGLAVDAAGQECLIELSGKIKPVASVAVQALAQGGTRRSSAQTQGANEEGVAREVLDGVKVVLAKAQKEVTDSGEC